MKYGFVLPCGGADIAATFAVEAEMAGWDGFFAWEPVWGHDAWISLTAAAMRTERIRLGTLLTPLSRLRPWKLAGEVSSLDRLSGGRVILAVGLGAPSSGFGKFGEITDRRTRAELLDEGLDILNGLWTEGDAFSYSGKHYQISGEPMPTGAPPPSVQQPRVPIWCVGAWPFPKSMNRVARCDGLLPIVVNKNSDETRQYAETTPAHLHAMRAYIDKHRTLDTPFDIIMEGETPGDDPAAAAAIIGRWADAGATWWIETRWDLPRNDAGLQRALERIRQGPPSV